MDLRQRKRDISLMILKQKNFKQMKQRTTYDHVNGVPEELNLNAANAIGIIVPGDVHSVIHCITVMTAAPMRTSAHFVLKTKAVATFIHLPLKSLKKMLNLLRKEDVIIMPLEQ